MESVFLTFWLTLTMELGDKTQVLCLLLAARFKSTLPILLGVFVGSFLNHLIAAYIGSHAFQFVNPDYLSYLSALVFIVFGILIFYSKSFGEVSIPFDRYGAFFTTAVAFFIFEIGDKTQITVSALAIEYGRYLEIALASSFAMLVVSLPVVILGDRFLSKIPVRIIQAISALSFFLMAFWILFKTL